MPEGAEAELVDQVAVEFNGNKTRWEYQLHLDIPAEGQETGYYITSSESNFENGVVISIHEGPFKEDYYSVARIYEYKPDDNTTGYFQ